MARSWWWQRWRTQEIVVRQLADELHGHLEQAVAEETTAGASATEARRRALVALGGVDQAKEQYRGRTHPSRPLRPGPRRPPHGSVSCPGFLVGQRPARADARDRRRNDGVHDGECDGHPRSAGSRPRAPRIPLDRRRPGSAGRRLAARLSRLAAALDRSRCGRVRARHDGPGERRPRPRTVQMGCTSRPTPSTPWGSRRCSAATSPRTTIGRGRLQWSSWPPVCGKPVTVRTQG